VADHRTFAQQQWCTHTFWQYAGVTAITAGSYAVIQDGL
jgi:hypothetical protein